MMERHAEMIDTLGCSTAADVPACLRALPAAELVLLATGEAIDLAPTLAASVAFAPNVDGVLLEEDPYDRIAGGRRPDVPILFGSNASEAFIFTVGDVILTRLQYESRIRTLVPEHADAVLAAYPVGDFMHAKEAWNTLVGDIGFVCPALSLVEAASAGSAPAFSYHYTHVLGGICGTGGAIHAAELVLVFGNYPDACRARGEDIALEAAIQGAWTSFAHAGAPETVPPWPAYDPASASIAVLAQPITMTEEIRDGRCAALRAAALVP
jgi:para-nitrobenzyl esterase